MMRPKTTRNQKIAPLVDPAVLEKREQIQKHIAAARAELEKAEAIADEIGEPFAFLDNTYTPRETIVRAGGWNEPEEWDSSQC